MAPPTPETLAQSGEIRFEFYRSAGPGGQNVNKVSSAARLRFDLRATTLIPEDVQARLARLAGRRLTEEGVLILEAQRFRTQERNREDALQRLAELIRQAWEPPRARLRTRKTFSSKQRRLESKRHRSMLKKGRSQGKNWEG